MKEDALRDDDMVVRAHRRKPRHLAEKLEGYVGVGIVIVAAVLLVLMLFVFPQTGYGVPSYIPR
jgi:hypothetical protein